MSPLRKVVSLGITFFDTMTMAVKVGVMTSTMTLKMPRACLVGAELIKLNLIGKTTKQV